MENDTDYMKYQNNLKWNHQSLNTQIVFKRSTEICLTDPYIVVNHVNSQAIATHDKSI